MKWLADIVEELAIVVSVSERTGVVVGRSPVRDSYLPRPTDEH